MPRRERTGFTLVEVLIACALGGLVLALALRALGELNRAGNLDRSRHEAQAQASLGLQKLSQEIRSAHVFFYSAHPMQAQAAVFPGTKAKPAPRDPALPATLKTAANPGNTRRPPGDPDQQTDKTKWSPAALTSIAAFRFTDPGDGPAYTRLQVAAARVTGDDYNDFFPGPLAYFAKAEFQATKSEDTLNGRALLPVSWTFYVLYLAPMNLDNRDANVAEWTPRDDFPKPPGGPTPANPHRTALPLQLRMLVIPGVHAGADDTTDVPLPSGDVVHYDPTSGRALAPNLAAGQAAFLDPPFDYAGTTGAKQPNYDPICLPMTSSLADLVNPGVSPGYRYRDGAGNIQTRPPSGPRIAGGGLHTNYNMIGNDPPTDAALGDRPGAPAIQDKLIASYIDPDSVAGTCVRFVNNMREPPAGQVADANGTITIPATGKPYRRYIPAFGPECYYLENRYSDLWPVDPSFDPSTGAYGAVPKSALLSFTIRYRTRKDLPFQFATASQQVDLDGVAAFGQVRARRHT